MGSKLVKKVVIKFKSLKVKKFFKPSNLLTFKPFKLQTLSFS